MRIIAHRHCDFSYGLRIADHEGEGRYLHGNNARIHFYCEGVPKEPVQEVIGGELPSINAQNGLDELGRVIDFSVIDERLCSWVEDNWNHKFLYWQQDTLMLGVESAVKKSDAMSLKDHSDFFQSLVSLPFNPTVENMAEHLLRVIGPQRLAGTGTYLSKVKIEVDSQCSAICEI